MNIAGFCMTTPLGLTAAATQRACAAGISRATVIDEHPRRPTAVRLSSLPALLNREDRMQALLHLCAKQLPAPWFAPGVAPVPCFLAVPEPGGTFDVRRWLAALGGVPELAALDIRRDRCIQAGRVGFFRCLQLAHGLIADAHGPAWAVAGAVDSLVDPATLELLAATGCVLGDTNSDGVIPGEAAGLVVLANAAAVRRHTLLLARIAAIVEAHDPAPAHARTPYAAEALTEVFRALRGHRATAGGRVDRVLTCQPGASFWAHEFAAAYLRNAEMMPEPLDHRGLIGSLGDVGAAAGVCQVGLALHAFAPSPWLPVAPLRRVVVHGSTDDGACMGCLLVHPEIAT